METLSQSWNFGPVETPAHYVNFFDIFIKFFQKHNQGVKLFAKVISKQQKLPLAMKELPKLPLAMKELPIVLRRAVAKWLSP